MPDKILSLQLYLPDKHSIKTKLTKNLFDLSLSVQYLPYYIPRSRKLIALLSGLAIAVVFSLSGCAGRRSEINIDDIPLKVEILRLDRDLFGIDIDSIPQQLPYIKDKYGEFFEIYNHLIIRTGSTGSPAYAQHLRRFLTDFDIHMLNREVEMIFPDLSLMESEIEKAFKRFTHYFPGYPVPQVYTFLSGFNQSIVAADNILGIGLDKYLGRDHKFYGQLQLSGFQRDKMYPEKIPADCMIGWAMTEFEFDEGAGDLLNHLIYHGKLLYFADMVLPHQHDTLKTGFTLAQLEWCKRNEKHMWVHIVENRLLFSTDMRTINGFIGEGPFTSAFSRDSPARAAVWLGWQIVKSFMQRNSHYTLEDLMLETDYQAILKNARYRP
jgi:hypothetical protein